jgi:hypothetical protein
LSYFSFHRCTAGNPARGYAENLRAALISLRGEHVAASETYAVAFNYRTAWKPSVNAASTFALTYAPHPELIPLQHA